MIYVTFKAIGARTFVAAANLYLFVISKTPDMRPTLSHLLGAMLIIVLFSACKKEETTTATETESSGSNCDYSTILDQNLYFNGPADSLSFESIEINESCLSITFSAEGCDGSSWNVNLYESMENDPSSPTLKFLRLSLDNDETCGDTVTETISYDLSPLHDNSADSPRTLNLHFTGTGLQYVYTY